MSLKVSEDTTSFQLLRTNYYRMKTPHCSLLQVIETKNIFKKKSIVIAIFFFNYSYAFFLSEAFQRARRKMQEARESLPRDVIDSTSQLQLESTA